MCPNGFPGQSSDILSFIRQCVLRNVPISNAISDQCPSISSLNNVFLFEMFKFRIPNELATHNCSFVFPLKLSARKTCSLMTNQEFYFEFTRYKI